MPLVRRDWRLLFWGNLEDTETIAEIWQKIETIIEVRQNTETINEEEEKQMRKMYMNIHRAILFPSWEIKTDLEIDKVENK